jgi:hypothetical protein
VKDQYHGDQLAEVATIVETRSDRRVDGVVRWRRIDLLKGNRRREQGSNPLVPINFEVHASEMNHAICCRRRSLEAWTDTPISRAAEAPG